MCIRDRRTGSWLSIITLIAYILTKVSVTAYTGGIFLEFLLGLPLDVYKRQAEAYDVLSNPDKRARYDQFGHAGMSGAAGGGFEGFGQGMSCLLYTSRCV